MNKNLFVILNSRRKLVYPVQTVKIIYHTQIMTDYLFSRLFIYTTIILV